MKYIAFHILLLIILLVLLSSCMGSNRIEDMAYVLAIGIDKCDEPDMNKYTFQFVKTNHFGKRAGDSKPNEEKQNASKNPALTNFTINAPTVFDALEVINLSMAKTPDLTHAKLILISDELAAEGIDKELSSLTGYNEFQSNLFVAVAVGGCEKYLSNVNSPLQTNPTRYYDMVFNGQVSPYLPGVYLKDLALAAQSDEMQAVVPLVGVGDAKSAEDLAPAFETDGFTKFTVEVGKNAALSEVDSEAMGMAIFKGFKLDAKLTGQDCFIYHIINGSIKPAYFINKDEYACLLKQKRKPIISVNLDEDEPRIEIDISLTGELIAKYTQTNTDEITSAIESTLEQECEQFLERIISRDADIFGFGKRAKIGTYTFADVSERNFAQRFKKSQAYVRVNAEIKRPSRIL